MGESNTYTDWMQAELLARLNAPIEVTQLLPFPSASEATVVGNQLTIERLRRTNAERLAACEAQITPISPLFQLTSSLEGRKTASQPCSQQETTNSAVVTDLERGKLQRGTIQMDENRAGMEDSCILAQIVLHNSQLYHLISLSDSTLAAFMLRLEGVSSDLKDKVAVLKAELEVLSTEIGCERILTLQEALKQVINRENILKRYELVKQELLSSWKEWPLADIFANQKQAALQILANIHTNDHYMCNAVAKAAFGDLERTIQELTQHHEPTKAHISELGQHIVDLSLLHNRILSAESANFPHEIPSTAVTDQLQATRLSKALELSERSLTILADLATSDPAPIQHLTTLRLEQAERNNLPALVSLEEEHQALRTQYLRDIPNLLVTAGLLKSMLEEVRTLRGDLREKLGKAQQTAALEEMAKSDSLETEAFEALYSLFHATQNASKDRLLYIVHERLTLLISRHRSLQGIGFLPPDLSARTELETSWKRLLTLIDDQISLVTETYHKLTVDDVDTRAKLETLLEERKPELTEAPAFAIGFDYLSELVAAIRQMIEQTDNLTDVIKEIRDVDSSLRQCELTMQDNYYKLKPVVGVEDCRKRERKRTFLTITHAEPLTPKEGIYILTDIIAALKKNANNLFEIENKRVQVVENSLNVKRAREALELLHEVSGAERVLRLDSANQLLSIPGAGEEARQASLLAQGLTPCPVSIPPLSDSITAFLTEVLPWLQESLAYDQALNRLIRKAAFYLD